MATDLHSLTEAEREILRLLAEGHTAKSIAVTIDRSVGSVNERLREARRKTGIGSSRELARLLAAQENRDKQMGVDAKPSSDRQPARSATASARPKPQRAGAITMGAIAIAAATAALMSVAGDDRPSAPQDTSESAIADRIAADPFLSGTGLPSAPNPRKLYVRLRSEERDADWAEAQETAIRERYDQVPGIEAGRETLRIICARTLCEVAGSLPKGMEATDAAMAGLQGTSLRNALSALGLKNLVMSFGGENREGRRLFYAYWERVPAD